MLGWCIVFIVLIILFALLAKVYDDASIFIVLLAILVILAIFPAGFLYENTRDTSIFKSQSQYFETHQPNIEIEDAALTQKKIEINTWLYKAQWNKEQFKMFSLYPNEVLELQPIQ